jgi:hypothetical protein
MFQQLSDEQRTEREFEIIDYVSANPGTSKEAIIEKMQNRNISSRVTTFKRIQELIRDGVIVAQKEKPNSQIYKLYINKSDKASAIMQEIRAFERSFFAYLQQVVNLYNEKNLVKTKKGTNDSKLVIYTCGFFYLVIDEYMSLARRVWPIEIQDEETLSRLYSNFFIRIARMETRLVNYAHRDSVMALAVSEPTESFPWIGPIYAAILKRYNLYRGFEEVVHSLKSLDLEFLFSQKS